MDGEPRADGDLDGYRRLAGAVIRAVLLGPSWSRDQWLRSLDCTWWCLVAGLNPDALRREALRLGTPGPREAPARDSGAAFDDDGPLEAG